MCSYEPHPPFSRALPHPNGLSTEMIRRNADRSNNTQHVSCSHELFQWGHCVKREKSPLNGARTKITSAHAQQPTTEKRVSGGIRACFRSTKSQILFTTCGAECGLSFSASEPVLFSIPQITMMILILQNNWILIKAFLALPMET